MTVGFAEGHGLEVRRIVYLPLTQAYDDEPFWRPC